MTEYIVATPFVELAPEMVVELDPEQAHRCRLVVTRVSDTAFKLLQPIHFKRGERLGLPSLPKRYSHDLYPFRRLAESADATGEPPLTASGHPSASPPPSLASSRSPKRGK